MTVVFSTGTQVLGTRGYGDADNNHGEAFPYRSQGPSSSRFSFTASAASWGSGSGLNRRMSMKLIKTRPAGRRACT